MDAKSPSWGASLLAARHSAHVMQMQVLAKRGSRSLQAAVTVECHMTILAVHL